MKTLPCTIMCFKHIFCKTYFYTDKQLGDLIWNFTFNIDPKKCNLWKMKGRRMKHSAPGKTKDMNPGIRDETAGISF